MASSSDSSSSKPGSWTFKLHNILRPAPHPLVVKFSNSRSRFRHSPGDIWRHALSGSVYRDLSMAGGPGGSRPAGLDEEDSERALNSTGSSKNLASTTVQTQTWQRFVRVEQFGLSGLLFYQIRLPGPGLGIGDAESLTLSGEGDGDNIQQLLTLESVFGDSDDPLDPGMDVDDLLDAVHAKLVYFPAYACTSFIMGQAVTAFFHNRPMLQPRPDREGFSVLSSESESESPDTFCDVFSATCPGALSLNPTKAVFENVPDLEDEDEYDFVSSRSSSSGDLDLDTIDAFSLDPNDPHTSLCVRSSTLSHPISRVSSLSDNESDNEMESGDTSNSTIDSLGPLTPPRIRSGGINSRLSRSEGAAHKSAPPVFISAGTVSLSVYEDLASFLDLSASATEVEGEWADLDGESEDEL